MIHDLTPIKFPKLHRFHSHFLQRIFLKKILKETHLILANSENTKRDIVEVYPFTQSKVSSILLGKDEDFKPLINLEDLKRFNLRDKNYLISV